MFKNTLDWFIIDKHIESPSRERGSDMPKKKSLILVVDDDIRMLRMMKRMLELEDFEVFTANCGEAALKAFEKDNPALVLLDIMMPDMDGYTVCRRIREFSQVPIIMVTARGDDKEKVEGLNIGADDYVTKPFSASELAARVRAVLRRISGQESRQESIFRYKDMVIDFTSRRVLVNNQELKLTSTEYKMLSYISLNAGRVVTPDQLLNKVWGEEYVGAAHLLQVNVARLRKKLGDNAKNPDYIQTRPGIGYIMTKPT
jgi:DNA-binding response OmpR family regulator